MPPIEAGHPVRSASLAPPRRSEGVEIPPLPPFFPRKTARPELSRTPKTATGMRGWCRIIRGSASEVRAEKT